MSGLMSSRAILVAAMCLPAIASAQRAEPREHLDRPLFVNDEWERYARVRQIAGDAPLHPWTIRAFSASETRKLNGATGRHPWRDRATTTAIAAGDVVRLTPVDGSAQLVANSAFPFGYNDGPVWAGRGLTTVASGGVTASVPGVTLTIAPLLFRAENSEFALGPTSDTTPFADMFAPGFIDTPQRFGTGAYQRLLPGNSRVEIARFGVSAGFGTDDQHWGPARDHPLILGNNAGGFPHAFFGSDQPVDLWIARAHTRLLWGRLDSSPYRPAAVAGRYRFAAGIALALLPRGVPGLELGFSRFFHLRWNEDVVNFDNITRPFIGVVRDFRRTPNDQIGDEPDNQIASLFARWVLPASGFEVYAEFGKDDYNKDLRDLAMEPDHLSGLLIGLQRVLRRGDSSAYHVLRVEHLDTRRTPLAVNRPQVPFYVHSPVYEGHTSDGQVLGSVAAFGGGATTVAADRYDAHGRMSLSASRMLRAEFFALGEVSSTAARSDFSHVLTIDGLRFRGRAALTYELTAVFESNRYFMRDAFNLRASSGVRYAW